MPDDGTSFSAPRGTRDLLPPGSSAWAKVTRQAMDAFARAGYEPIETPLFEHTEVFERGVGATTEVVGKQMYTFRDRGDRSLTLRPEGTAPVMRAVLEHNLDRGALPVKLAYSGPMFRQERPQKGRYRQFWQLGIESIGVRDPRVDAEVIELAMSFFAELSLEATLLLNSIGHPGDGCRGSYVAALRSFLEQRIDQLDPDDRERIETNPLRTFDSKLPRTQEALREAPVITDFLCDECAAHHEGVKAELSSVDIRWKDEPRLVRGLDYYTHTAFEFVAEGLGSQDAIGGGGRYDGLSQALGGAEIPGIGFALGLDRIMLALGEPQAATSVRAYVVALGEAALEQAFPLATRLRRAGIGADLDFAGRAMKGQMKDAARSGARYAVILGDDELAAGQATVKDLETGEQERVDLQALEERLKT